MLRMRIEWIVSARNDIPFRTGTITASEGFIL